MKLLFATIIILALAGCTNPHYKNRKHYKSSHSAAACCSNQTCKCAMVKKEKVRSNENKSDWNARARRLREAVRNGNMTAEEARSKAQEMRKRKK